MSLDVTAIVVASIATVGVAISGYFSYKAKKQTNTTNGHTAGQLIEALTTDVKEVRDGLTKIENWFVDHLANHNKGKP